MNPGAPESSWWKKYGKVAALSLAFTYLFFLDYLPPFRRVYIPFDLGGFHYPLADYAFQALKHGRFPEWDPTIYGGMPFAANPQAALFYPGTWLVLLASAGRRVLSFQSLEDFVFLHFWLAFLLCFFWLRRRLHPFASLCGAVSYAFGGYLLQQLQHLGVIAAYAWIPLGLMGIDEAAEEHRWSPMWKVAAASALGFLAGYTPTWFMAAVCMFAYALFRKQGWKIAIVTGVALAFSMLLAAVQLLPTMQLSALREAEARYGSGLRDPAYFVSYLIPNLYNFSVKMDVQTNRGFDYLYLGAPAILGLILILLIRRGPGGWSAAPLAGVLAISAVIVTNPGGAVWGVLQHSTLLGQLCRDYYFLAGVSIAGSALAAISIERFVCPPPDAVKRVFPRRTGFVLVAMLGIWCLRLANEFRRDRLLTGWASAWDAVVMLGLFTAGVAILRARSGTARGILAAALLITAGVDLKVHGTHKRFDATHDATGYDPRGLPAMDPAVYTQLAGSPMFRIALDQTGPLPLDLRHYGLRTPQGFDPFLTTSYKRLIERTGKFRTNWEFDLDPANRDGLDALGVRYFLTSEQAPLYAQLAADSRYRLLQPSLYYYKVFERIDAAPMFGWEPAGTPASMATGRWDPELREFAVRLARPARFHLSEQWNPGWHAYVDGMEVPIDRWQDAFQQIVVPSGEHRIVFQFRDQALRIGAIISLLSLLSMLALLRLTGGNPQDSKE